MATAFTIRNQAAVHFVTFTVHQWVDVFSRKVYVNLLLENLQYCQKEKGLEVFAWVIMSNHLHLIIRSKTGQLSDVIRDYKKYTAKKIIEAIEGNPKESRRNWMLWLFKKDEVTWFWEPGYHGEEIFTTSFFESKCNYIHLNPVRAGIVEKEEEYLYSSCGDFYGVRKGPLELAEF